MPCVWGELVGPRVPLGRCRSGNPPRQGWLGENLFDPPLHHPGKRRPSHLSGWMRKKKNKKNLGVGSRPRGREQELGLVCSSAKRLYVFLGGFCGSPIWVCSAPVLGRVGPAGKGRGLRWEMTVPTQIHLGLCIQTQPGLKTLIIEVGFTAFPFLGAKALCKWEQDGSR